MTADGGGCNEITTAEGRQLRRSVMEYDDMQYKEKTTAERGRSGDNASDQDMIPMPYTGLEDVGDRGQRKLLCAVKTRCDGGDGQIDGGCIE